MERVVLQVVIMVLVVILCVNMKLYNLTSLILTGLLFLLSSCIGGSPTSFSNIAKPGGRVYTFRPTGGTLAFNQGWEDGCTSAGSTNFAHGFYGNFYGYVKDIRFIGMKYGDERDLFQGNPITDKEKKEYNTGWGTSYGVCRAFFLGNQKGGPGMMPFVTGKGDYYRMGGLQNIYEPRAWGPAGDGGFYGNW